MVSLILIFLSIFCASIPMLLFVAFVWWMDRYDREPIWLVACTFLWGAVGGVVLAIVGSSICIVILSFLFDPATTSVLSPIVVAPIIEEPTKAIVLFLVARSKHFDNTTDGFVYGAAAGLGFGMTENFMYFSNVAMSGSILMWATNVFVRTFYSAVMHATATSIVGAAIGWSRWRGAGSHLTVVGFGFALAMGIHALWNGLLVVDQFTTIAAAGINYFIFPLEVAAILAVFQACVWSERRVIVRHLTNEARRGTLPLRFVPILASHLRRSKQGWLPPDTSLDTYVVTATQLAFRLEQASTAPKKHRDAYTKDADSLRMSLKEMLPA